MPSSWYLELKKPAWTPSPETIGLIWSILYPIIIAVFLYVCWKVYRGEMGKSVLYFFLFNLVTNLIFTPIQFGLKNLPLAAFDILLVLASIVAIIASAWPYSRLVSFALTPYLIWVSVATVLQLTITWMNR